MKIEKLNKKIKKECKKHLLCKHSKVIVGEGNEKANIMLIGQNPGAEENKLGRPFVGRAGKFLDEILNKYGIERKNLYITSVVKCKTPKNRKPTKKEIEFFMPFLVEQINLVKPKIIVLMGEIAWKTPRIKKLKAKYIKTYHPAAAMRFPKIRKKFEKDFKILSDLNQRLKNKKNRK
jgi:DNA polymerase